MAATSTDGAGGSGLDSWIAGDIWIAAAGKPATFHAVPRKEITVTAVVLEYYSDDAAAEKPALAIADFSIIKPGAPEPALRLENEDLVWQPTRGIHGLTHDVSRADPRLILVDPFEMEVALVEKAGGDRTAIPGELRVILTFEVWA